MRNLAVTLFAIGMVAPACAPRGTPQVIVNPLPGFASYEPQRAPLLQDKQELEAIAEIEDQGTPMVAIVIAGMTEPEKKPALKPVYFAFGSAMLDDDDREQLGEAASWLRAHPDQTIVIEGHTDAVGSFQYNLALGELRAHAVRDYLIQLGIAEQRMTITSLGEQQPVSEARGDLNRRSEVVPVPEAEPEPE